MFRELRRYQLTIDIVLAGLFFVAPLPFLLHGDSGVGDFLALAGMSVALAFRRLSPEIALGVAWLSAIVQMVTGSAPGWSDLAVLAVLYATARYGGRTLRWIGLGSAALGAVIAALYLFIFQALLTGTVGLTDNPPVAVAIVSIAALGLFALLGLSWTIGLLAMVSARGRQSRRAQLIAERDIVVEQERNRIARDMHDVVAHSLAVVIAQADGARYVRATNPEAVDNALSSISSTAREALADVRVLLGQLRHSEADGPQPVLADLNRLFDQLRASGLQLRQEQEGVPALLGGGQQLAIYRIVQEALTNALRHGDITQEAVVTFRWRPHAVIVSIDNAVRAGVKAGVTENPGGHGLAGMRERALLAGGTISTGLDAAGERYVVTVELPIGEVSR